MQTGPLLSQTPAKAYYEGWYLKHQQGDDAASVLALIPGRAQNEAFIQVIARQRSWYIPYPVSAYHAAGLRGPKRVGQSLFTRHGARLHIHTPELKLTGTLRYSGLTPLPYSIMGPFAPLPLETKHAVYSLRHTVNGTLWLNGTPLRYQNGCGYHEGDAGHSFPAGYIWLQCGGFAPGSCVMVAVASVPLPLLPKPLQGCIAVVLHEGRQYRFATYLGVQVLRCDAATLHLRQRGLELLVQVGQGKGHPLQAPTGAAMARVIHEDAARHASVVFKKHGATLLRGSSETASFEYQPPKQEKQKGGQKP